MTTHSRASTVQLGPQTGACLVCGGRYVPARLPGLVQCVSCGFVSADAALSDEELAALYGEDYFHGAEYLDYVNEEDSLRLNFRDRLATLARLRPDLRDTRLFEVGCAYGFFLDEARGWVRSAAGIDISEPAVSFARGQRGVEALCGDYLALSLSEPQDVIAMWDTIEHLARPNLFVQKAAADLRSGGLLAVTTGDIESLNARIRGGSWRMIHPPTHLHYFSVRTLSRLLDEAGIDVVHVSHPGIARRLRSIIYYVVAMRMKKPLLYQRLARLPIADLRLTVNLFDIMFVVGRKR